MILYLTYNDPPSGVYWSQVTDVVDHLNRLGGDRVKLVALVSLRGYFRSRRSIRQHSRGAWVLPMVPRAHRWRANWIWIMLACGRFRPSGIIGRGVFATALALHMKRAGRVSRVCFDGRGAYGAEWEEYRVVENEDLIAECAKIEHWVVLESDMRIAVSHQLVEHWRVRYGYTEEMRVVIPCTLESAQQVHYPKPDLDLRKSLGWSLDDIILVYSGSTMGWQSLELLSGILGQLLDSDPAIKVLFLTLDDKRIVELKEQYPERVARLWVQHSQVRSVLAACDIGLLLRSDSLTNRVASPTKFAEYLNAGIPVLISKGLGDLWLLVRDLGLGEVMGAGDLPTLNKPTEETRQRMVDVAAEKFAKASYTPEYLRLLRCMGDPRGAGPRLQAEMKEHPNKGLVSIVVPSFNKAAYINEMIASVQAQTHNNWELLIVDDASTDDTPTILAAHALADERIKLDFRGENSGANNCRNIGMHSAQGEYLVFLDADDVLAAHCLESRLRAAAQGDQDMIISTMEVFNQKPGDGTNRWVPSAKDPLADFMRHRLPWSVMQPLWKRSFLVELNGFDTSFSRHQDVELHTRALLHPCVRFRTLIGPPDCFYRIAEERKVIDPLPLLQQFSESAVLYRNKFMAAAKSMGFSELLLGILHRTYLQVLLNVKLGRIDADDLGQLEEILFAQSPGEKIAPRDRALFRFTRWYNLLPIRIPGINRIVFGILTGSGRPRR